MAGKPIENDFQFFFISRVSKCTVMSGAMANEAGFRVTTFRSLTKDQATTITPQWTR